MSADKNELLKKALLEAREKEFENIPAEDELKEEHVFSMDFEKKMHDLTKKNKVSGTISRLGKYAAGFAIVCMLTGAAFMIINRGDLSFKKAADSSISDNSASDSIGEIAEGIINEDAYADENKAASSAKDGVIYYGADIPGYEDKTGDIKEEAMPEAVPENEAEIIADEIKYNIYEEGDMEVIEIKPDVNGDPSVHVSDASICAISSAGEATLYSYGDESEDFDIVIDDTSVKYYVRKPEQQPDGSFSGIQNVIVNFDTEGAGCQMSFIRTPEGKLVYDEG